jgi:hypothetical protein
MSRYQWVPDPNRDGFGYNIWLIASQDDRIYPIIVIYLQNHLMTKEKFD